MRVDSDLRETAVNDLKSGFVLEHQLFRQVIVWKNLVSRLEAVDRGSENVSRSKEKLYVAHIVRSGLLCQEIVGSTVFALLIVGGKLGTEEL